MSWNEMKEAKETSSSNLYIKLKDGDSVEGVFMGEPYCFYQAFKEREEHRDWAEGRGFKFKINFMVLSPSGFISKVFQGGATIRDALIDAKEEYGMDCVYKIKRVGSGKEDTRYSVLFKSKLTDTQKAELLDIPLKPFNKTDEEPPVHEDEDAPPF